MGASPTGTPVDRRPTGRRIGLHRVVDGDSLEVELDGAIVDVRLVGYNAPELYGPGQFGSGSRQCNGEAAALALVELLEGRSLTAHRRRAGPVRPAAGRGVGRPTGAPWRTT